MANPPPSYTLHPQVKVDDLSQELVCDWCGTPSGWVREFEGSVWGGENRVGCVGGSYIPDLATPSPLSGRVVPWSSVVMAPLNVYGLLC